MPHILVEIPLGDEVLLNRDVAMLEFCDIQSRQFDFASPRDKERHGLTTCMAGPGTGKSRFG